MAGEWFLGMLSKRAGGDSDYADIVFGKVISDKDKPLKVQYANDLILTEEFLMLSKHVTDYEELIEIDCDGEKKKQTIKHLNKLEKGDKVVMVREDGGQAFFILEKIPEEEPKPKKEAIAWLKKTFKMN